MPTGKLALFFQIGFYACHSALDAESIITKKLDSRFHGNDKTNTQYE